jgi:REP element-mobilizing transposase RayT
VHAFLFANKNAYFSESARIFACKRSHGDLKYKKYFDVMQTPAQDKKIWHSRGYLPHFEGGERVQSATLRLYDSIPPDTIKRWETELQGNDGRDSALRKRIDAYLDQGFGECYLRAPQIAALVQDSLLFHDSKKYRLVAWVIMPNHLHLLFIPIDGSSLSSIMHSIKSYSANEANKMLSRTGKFWQKEYFDRYIRDENHFANIVSCIAMNPVKARLCKNPSDWRFSSAYVKH